MARKQKRSLSSVVGTETYAVWVIMLFASSVADGKQNKDLDDDSVEMSLLSAAEAADPSEVKDQLHDVVTQLFKDAGVEYQRTSSRSVKYSIEEETYEEFMHWFDMPWE